MKLNEIKRLSEARSYPTEVFKDLDLWLGVGSTSDLDTADVEVEYEYEAPSHTDHPYGSTTAREYHGSSTDIISVKLLKDTDRFNEDGEVIGKLEKGTDLMQQKWWKSEWSDWLAEKIGEKMDHYDPREDYEPDHDDR